LKKIVTLSVMILSMLGSAQAQHDTHAHSHVAPRPQAEFGKAFQRYAAEMTLGMNKMMSDMHAPGYTGDPDIDFLAMMIPHHEGAVDMARLVLLHGNDPVTRKVAEEIIANQRVEIEGMQRRLDDLKRGASRANPGGYPALGGTRKP
jgi:uncharacterized protein (DUF305 family)